MTGPLTPAEDDLARAVLSDLAEAVRRLSNNDEHIVAALGFFLMGAPADRVLMVLRSAPDWQTAYRLLRRDAGFPE